MFLQNFLKEFTEELKWHIPRIGLRNVALKGCKKKKRCRLKFRLSRQRSLVHNSNK